MRQNLSNHAARYTGAGKNSAGKKKANPRPRHASDEAFRLPGASWTRPQGPYSLLYWNMDLPRRLSPAPASRIMAFSEEEKDLVVQSLQYYLQQAGAQLPPQAVQQLMTMAKSIVGKLDQPGGGAQPGEPPPGISREWFDNVCTGCPQLTATGCADKITAKFPGKCDPILIYERGKAVA